MERQPVHRFSQIFLKLVVNEVNIGAYLDDVLVYVNFGNNKQAVRRFRVIDRAVEQPLAQVSLRVKVNAQHTFAVAQTETDSQILRDGSFTGAALLIDEGEDPGWFFLYRGDRDIALKSLRPKRGKCLFSHISGSLNIGYGGASGDASDRTSWRRDEEYRLRRRRFQQQFTARLITVLRRPSDQLSLFVPQSHYWIHLHRPPRRQVTSQQCDHCQDCRDRDKGYGISRANFIKQARHQPRQR